MKTPRTFCYSGGMKTITLRSVLFALILGSTFLLSACQNAPAARVSAERSLAFAASVQGSPDLMGGLVGREAVSGRPAASQRQDSAQMQRAQYDLRAYVIWKASQRS